MKLTDFYINNELPDQFSSMIIDNIEFYCPRITVRKEIRKLAEKHLRKKYDPGRYTDSIKITEILNHQFNFYNTKLNRTIPTIFSKDILAFTLFQYEISGKLATKYKNNTLNDQDYIFWGKNGPTLRQAADLLCDKFIEFSNNNQTDLDFQTITILYDTAWICAENCVEYASASNSTHMIMKEESFLEVLPPNNEIFIDHGTTEKSRFSVCYNYYVNQTNKDINLRKELIEGNEFDHDISKHIAILDKPLKEFLGMSYSEILYLLTNISISTRPITSPAKIPMVDKEKYLEEFSNQSGFPYESIKRLFDAVILSKKKLKDNPREVWDYKQENRISKKPFLEFSFNKKDHLIWSDQKLQDFLLLLDLDVTFKNFPEELMDKNVAIAIDKVSNKAGKWFELQVALQMNKLNILGSGVKRRIKSDITAVEIKCSAGELDFLGLSEADSSIVLLECKMMNSGFEAKSFRQDIDKFIRGNECYVKKLKKKLNWIFDNFDTIKAILCEKYRIKESNISRKVTCCFITYYTSMVPCFLEEFPCVSLVEFIDKYKNESKWPYSKGVKYERIQ